MPYVLNVSPLLSPRKNELLAGDPIHKPNNNVTKYVKKNQPFDFFYLLNFIYRSDKSYVGLGEESDKPPYSCWLSW